MVAALIENSNLENKSMNEKLGEKWPTIAGMGRYALPLKARYMLLLHYYYFQHLN